MSYVYWLVLLSTVLFASIAEKNPRAHRLPSGETVLRPDPVLATVISLILISVAGLRHGVGTDYWVYYRSHVTDWSTVWEAMITYREPGIRLIGKITRDISNTGTGLIFASSLITVGIYCLMIYRHSPMYLVSMLLFLFLGDWSGSFNGVRQYLAAAVLFAGHRLILKRKLVPYLLVVFLASLFHTTALVMIIPYFLYTRKPNMTQFLILAVGAIAIRLSYDTVFSLIGGYKGTIVNMQDEYMTRDIHPLRIAVSFIPVILFFLSCDREHMKEEEAFYINALLFNAFAMFAAAGSAYLGRIGLYTGAMSIIGYGHVFRLIPEERTRKLSGALICFVLLIYWIYSMRASSIANFRWVFQR